MATRVIAKHTLKKYAEHFPDAKNALMAWHDTVCKATVNCFAAAQSIDPKVSLVNKEYLIWDVRGGRYRLITKVYFPAATIYIKDFQTHAEYDKWSAEMRKKKGR